MQDRLERLIKDVAEVRDTTAFKELFEHFAPRIKSYLLRQGAGNEEAEELMQEAMIMVWKKAESFNPGQASLSTWIFTIARNKRIDLLRKEKGGIATYDYSLVHQEDKRADDTLISRQEEVRLRRALTKLPADQADILKLAFWGDKSHGVIANESGLPLGTVKSRIRLAMQRLRGILEEE